MNPIAVIFLTYQRTEYAVKTLASFRRFAKYENFLWYVADDGSSREHYRRVHELLDGCHIIGSHNERLSYGGGANRAIETAKRNTPLMFFLEDDWQLREELDLNPYAQLLDDITDVGMVRLGYLNLNMRGKVFGYRGHLYWRLDRDADQYVFTGHPSLRHVRFHTQYGLYPENLYPGQTELGMAYQYRQGQGSDIVYPVRIGEYGPFAHIGTQQSYKMSSSASSL